MKRRICCLLAAIWMLCCAALSEGLSAAPGDVVPLTIDHCVPGNEYVLLMLKEGANLNSLKDTDILFVDVVTALGQRRFGGRRLSRPQPL